MTLASHRTDQPCAGSPAAYCEVEVSSTAGYVTTRPYVKLKGPVALAALRSARETGERQDAFAQPEIRSVISASPSCASTWSRVLTVGAGGARMA